MEEIEEKFIFKHDLEKNFKRLIGMFLMKFCLIKALVKKHKIRSCFLDFPLDCIYFELLVDAANLI